MPAPKIIKGDPLRGYIHWEGRWRHVYIVGSVDQATIMGDTVRVLNFRLTKKSKDILQAEKSKFHKKKPTVQNQKRILGA